MHVSKRIFSTVVALGLAGSGSALGQRQTVDGIVLGPAEPADESTFHIDATGKALRRLPQVPGVVCGPYQENWPLELPLYGELGVLVGRLPGEPDVRLFAWGHTPVVDQPPAPGFAAGRAPCGPEFSETQLTLGSEQSDLPPLPAPGWIGVVPIDAAGVAVLPTVAGLWRMPADASSAPTPWVSQASLTAALEAAAPAPYAYTRALPTESEAHLFTGAYVPSGTLLLWLTMPLADATHAYWLAAIDPAGAVQVIGRPEDFHRAGLVDVFHPPAWVPVLDGFLVDCGPKLCLVRPAGVAPGAPIGRLSGALGFDEEYLLGAIAGDGQAWALMDPNVADQRFQRPIVAGVLDVDHDGLPSAVEAALGTDEANPDTDGDGVEDGPEHRYFGTDPLDPASRPPRPATPLPLAPSMFIMDWDLLPERDALADAQVLGTWRGALCIPEVGGVGAALGQYRCHRGDGSVFGPIPGGEPDFTPELDYALAYPNRYEVATGATTPLPDTQFRRLLALDGDTFFEVRDDNRVVVRHSPEGAFEVINLNREACPLLGEAAEAEVRCADPAEAIVDAADALPVGFHPPSGGWVFGISTPTRGHFYVVVDHHRAERIAHSDRMGGARLHLSATLPGDVLWARLDRYPDGTSTMAPLDLALGPLAPEANAGAPVMQPGPWFRSGFLERGSYVTYMLPLGSGEDGGCVSVGEVTLCAFDAPVMPDGTLEISTYTEWVPVAPTLAPGEAVVFFNQRASVQNTVVSGTDPDWALWRFTALGAMHRWIDRDTFAAAMAPEDRAVFNADWAIVDLDVHPDRRRICAVQAYLTGPGRTWILELDEAGALTRVRAVGEGLDRACLWRGDDLVRVEDRPNGAAVVSAQGSQEVSVANAAGAELLAEGEVLVWSRRGDAVCVRPGQVLGAARQIKAAAFAEGLVWFIDAEGLPRVIEREGICGSGPAVEEALTELVFQPTPVNLWAALARRSNTLWAADVDRAHLAVRPDGQVLFTTENLHAAGQPDGGSLYRDRLYRLQPSFTPPPNGLRFERFDPRRREKGFPRFSTFAAEAPTALAMVPWTESEPESDWAWFGREKPAPFPPPEAPGPRADLGADAGTDAASAGDEGCGCRQPSTPVGTDGLWLLGLWGLRPRRRREAVANSEG